MRAPLDGSRRPRALVFFLYGSEPGFSQVLANLLKANTADGMEQSRFVGLVEKGADGLISGVRHGSIVCRKATTDCAIHHKLPEPWIEEGGFVMPNTATFVTPGQTTKVLTPFEV